MMAGRVSKLLVSVSSYAEALEVLTTEADIMDLKNPEEGALGALSLEEIRCIVVAVNGCKKTSATIGDMPMQPDVVRQRVIQTLATGVDMVKIGFFGTHGHEACVDVLEDIARNNRLVAVLFADDSPNLELLPRLQQAGFYGVMLDTAHKNGQNLLDHLSIEELERFLTKARALGLCTGLAGSLRAGHVDALARLRPDYLGFRGGICDRFERRNKIDGTKIFNLHQMLHKSNTMPA